MNISHSKCKDNVILIERAFKKQDKFYSIGIELSFLSIMYKYDKTIKPQNGIETLLMSKKKKI